MLTYIKSSHTDPLKEGEMGKMRLSVNGADIENIWVKRFKDYSVLQNHAFNLYPFESWGMIVPSVADQYDLSEILEGDTLELHPEAFADYLAADVIDIDGKYIKKFEQKEVEDDGTES